MKPKTVAAGILIAIGIVALVYQGVTYTSRDKMIDMGPIHVTTERTHTLPIAPIAGAVVIAAGLILLLVDGKWFRGTA